MPDVTETRIAEYSQIEAGLAMLREKYAGTMWVVDTPSRMKGAKAARNEVRKYRTDLEAKRKEIKAPALSRCKAIDTEAKRIAAALLEIEQPIADAITEVEQAKKREEEARKRVEEERQAKCHAELDRIRNVPVELVGASLDQIQSAADELKSLDLTWTAEFSGMAMKFRDEAVERLRAMYAEAKSRQEEQARLEAERVELERLRSEQRAREREEEERRAEEARERMAKIEEQERESRERLAAEERAAREARMKADEEARKAREAEEARIRVERERVEAEQRAVADQKRKEREAREAAEAEERRKQTEVMEARHMLRVFRDRFGDRPEFVDVASAIDRYFEACEVAA